ncbi:hypothetical protein ANTRET_LOCUS2437 [Anthophora retusa]
MIFVDDSTGGFSLRVLSSTPRTRTPRICVPRNSLTLLPAPSDGQRTRMRTVKRRWSGVEGRGVWNGACIPQNQFAEMKFYSPPGEREGHPRRRTYVGADTRGARPPGYAPARTKCLRCVDHFSPSPFESRNRTRHRSPRVRVH